jgi:NADPH:quinone reductase-like Zn-dependent oxidoreductase
MRNTRVVLSALGGPEVFKVIEDEICDPGPNEVRIRILASGVSYADVLMRHGMYPGVPPIPYSPGYDIVGVVDSCGTDVTQWKTGDLIAALIQTGGYSRYIVLPPTWFREDLSRLLTMLQEKSISPVIAERLPLRHAARASELLEGASVSGKIVLMCQE